MTRANDLWKGFSVQSRLKRWILMGSIREVFSVKRIFTVLLLMTTPLSAAVTIEEAKTLDTPIWWVEDHTNPIIGVTLLFPRGTLIEPESHNGVLGVLSEMLFEGTQGYGAQALKELLDTHGIQMHISAGLDETMVSLRMLKANKEKALEAFEQIFHKATFPEDRLAHIKRLMIAGLKSRAESPSYHMQLLYNHVACGDHPSRHLHDGTEKTIAALTRDDLKAFYQRQFNRRGMKMTIVGDVDSQLMQQMGQRIIGALPFDPKAEDSPVPETPVLGTGKIHFTPFESRHASVVFFKKGLSYRDKRFFPFKVANEILGGSSLRSRLNQRLRVEKGLTYGIYQGETASRYDHVLSGQSSTKTETVEELISQVKDVWRVAQQGEVTEQELARAKNNIKSEFLRRFRTTAGVQASISGFMHLGLEKEYISRRNAHVDGVTREQVREIFQEMFDPNSLTFIVVGQKAPQGAVVENHLLPSAKGTRHD